MGELLYGHKLRGKSFCTKSTLEIQKNKDHLEPVETEAINSRANVEELHLTHEEGHHSISKTTGKERLTCA